MATYAEPYRPYEAVLSDAGTRSYEDITIASGAGSLVAGSVIGLVSKRQAAAPIPTVSGGTGTGTMSLLTFGPDVQVGSYLIKCTTAVTHGGVFSVTAPDGTALPTFTMTVGDGAVSRYTSSHLSFSITEGTSFILDNLFTVVVTAGGTPGAPNTTGGTGTGAISGITLGKYAQKGTYKLRITTTAATSPIQVTAPDGSALADGKIAVAYTGDHINFTVADGGTMTVGDYYNIIVAGYTAPEGKLWDPTAVDGTQEAYGILTAAADASSTSATGTVLVREAEVKSASLQWKSTVAAAQKTEAYRQLAAAFVQVRS